MKGAIGTALALGWMLACILCAWGHDGDDARAAWYRSLETPSGASCCNMHDCSPTDAKITNGHWEVPKAEGEGWEQVPDEVVLKRENEEGAAVVCRYFGGIRCFVPASGV